MSEMPFQDIQIIEMSSEITEMLHDKLHPSQMIETLFNIDTFSEMTERLRLRAAAGPHDLRQRVNREEVIFHQNSYLRDSPGSLRT
jgi:hypothetical protein